MGLGPARAGRVAGRMPLILVLSPGQPAAGAGEYPGDLFALAGDAAVILKVRLDLRYAAWWIYGTPTQPAGLFLLVRPDCTPREVPFDPGAVDWAVMSPSDLEEFLDDTRPPA